MCTHAINGQGCDRGDSCLDDHPANCEAAKGAYTAMGDNKSLRICASFLSGQCTHPSCTFLHAEIAPKAATAPVTPRGVPAGAPACPATPAKGARPPAGRRSAAPPSPTKTHGGAPRRAAAAKTDAHEEACVALRRIQGKLRALDKARDAFEVLGTTLDVAHARDDARRAAEMQAAALKELAEYSSRLDGYLAALGAKPDPDPDGDGEASAPVARQLF